MSVERLWSQSCCRREILSVSEVAAQEGISVATVYKWRKEAREQGRCLPNAGDGGAAAWSSKDKFGAVLETAAMNVEQIAEYCRCRGLYPEQIVAWRLDCEQAANLSQQERRQEALDAKAQRQRIRELERDLRLDTRGQPRSPLHQQEDQKAVHDYPQVMDQAPGQSRTTSPQDPRPAPSVCVLLGELGPDVV